MLALHAHDDVEAFAATARSYLDADLAGTTVLGTALSDVLGGSRTYPDATWFTVADEAGEVVGAAMHTPPYRVYLAPMPVEAADLVGRAAAELAAATPLPGIAGERVAVEAAAAAWLRERPHDRFAVGREIRLYVLGDRLVRPAVPGGSRVASHADTELLVAWLDAFAGEANTVNPDPVAAVRARLDGAGAYLVHEVDGTPVAMAAHGPPAAGTSRVGPVFTPTELRGRGYGSAVTAATTQHAHDTGARHVVLFTDLANPTSNSIYQRLGYQPVRDYVELDLTTS